VSNLSDLKKKYEELGDTIERLESDKYVLKLCVDIVNNLCIGFKNELGYHSDIGYISDDGGCYILSNYEAVEQYNLWRENGIKVDNTVVDWRGGSYQIDRHDYVLTRIDIPMGCIYNLDECKSQQHCGDENIRRFEHNNRPIIF